MRCHFVALGLLLAGCGVSGFAKAPAYHFIPGQIPADKGPDGNTIILDAPKGLIVVDTGRHPEHSAAILAFAEARGRPIAAIINSHWHLDHTTGNYDIRQVYPHADVYATNAIDGALATFLADGRKGAESRLTDPKTPAARLPEIRRFLARMDQPDSIRPSRPVLKSAKMKIAGRTLDVRVAPFAATEADLWFYDPKIKLAVVGDLVVGIVPFMDTACADGWAKALDAIAKVPFTTLIPGHGDPMTKADFLQWRTAYNNLLACARSAADKKQCIAGWDRDAAKFIDTGHKAYVDEAADYYIDSRLRASPAEQRHYCKPLK
ncbi:MBL fold metallo-hydrolase [Sphingomonas sp.]|uniref:MBL fold metallo-hydrolase n=1 Tax=Sphingomonas sp. TaxID=28214 RepID=UPI00286B3481|nr:MBL fold metallo-hydrolase [Sphingomonas sp.]